MLVPETVAGTFSMRESFDVARSSFLHVFSAKHFCLSCITRACVVRNETRDRISVFFLQQSRSSALLANSFAAPWPLRG
jgi:hypothetical protein